MAALDSDVSYALVNEAVALYRATDLDVVLSLAATCPVIRQAALSVLFATVHWPHANKHDDESGLLFFPATLWPYFKRFQLIWPEDWPEATPPRWGDRYYVGGDYNPRHIDKLVAALPAMPALSSVYLSCPFYPPNSLLSALIQCRALRDLSIHETPLSISTSPRVPSYFHLDRLAIVPVAEAVRVGDGAFDRRYAERTYYVREYRKKYRNDVLARRAAGAFVFEVGKTEWLRHVQISMDLCTLQAMGEHRWPVLDTLILTGHAPRGAGAGANANGNGSGGNGNGNGIASGSGSASAGAGGGSELLDVLAQMPALRELRLLFAKVKGEPPLRILPDDLSFPFPASGGGGGGGPPAVLKQLKHLAVSNACNIAGVLQHTTALERLAVLAIIDMPRVPIALGRADVERILGDLKVGQRNRGPGLQMQGVQNTRQRGTGTGLRRLRMMIEDKVNPDLCSAIAAHCPDLEALEIELCGYHDGKSIHAWEEFTDAFLPLSHLHSLRLCIQFPEFDEMDPYEPWRAARLECARFLAARLTSLRRVGLEYRKRTGTHRFEDGWLEFGVEREGEGEFEVERGQEGRARGGLGERGQEGREGGRGAGGTRVRECGEVWYPFPEVWCAVPVQEA